MKIFNGSQRLGVTTNGILEAHVTLKYNKWLSQISKGTVILWKQLGNLVRKQEGNICSGPCDMLANVVVRQQQHVWQRVAPAM